MLDCLCAGGQRNGCHILIPVLGAGVPRQHLSAELAAARHHQQPRSMARGAGERQHAHLHHLCRFPAPPTGQLFTDVDCCALRFVCVRNSLITDSAQHLPIYRYQMPCGQYRSIPYRCWVCSGWCAARSHALSAGPQYCSMRARCERHSAQASDATAGPHVMGIATLRRRARRRDGRLM